MRRFAFFLLAASASHLFRASSTRAEANDEDLIRRARQAWNEAIRAHDADAVASFFTDD